MSGRVSREASGKVGRKVGREVSGKVMQRKKSGFKHLGFDGGLGERVCIE